MDDGKDNAPQLIKIKILMNQQGLIEFILN